MNELPLMTDNLPEAAKKELLSFYEYLLYKYLKKKSKPKQVNTGENKHLAAFQRFKKLRNRVNPVVDKSLDIDKLINEVNRDIF